ncbi:MAG: hypothetical protein CMH97_10645, partial [Oceanospirillaceae bacterium]|nr:hypothetical protein [Oceanospirillaceae bacterium]
QQALGATLFPDQSEPRKKIRRWLVGAGINVANRRTIEAHFPETKCLFDLPLYPLLSSMKLSTAEIEKLLSPYKTSQSPGVHWELPARSILKLSPHRPIFGRSNSQALAETGSVQGFAVILGLVQLARLKLTTGSVEDKIIRNAEIQYHLTQAARAFPNVARHPIFREVWPLLYERFKALWLDALPDPTSTILDDGLMARYITMDTEYVLWRGAYGRHSDDGRLIVLPPPIITPERKELALTF